MKNYADVNDHLVQAILCLYTSETPIYQELNRASREADTELANALGPLSFTLFEII